MMSYRTEEDVDEYLQNRRNAAILFVGARHPPEAFAPDCFQHHVEPPTRTHLFGAGRVYCGNLTAHKTPCLGPYGITHRRLSTAQRTCNFPTTLFGAPLPRPPLQCQPHAPQTPTTMSAAHPPQCLGRVGSAGFGILLYHPKWARPTPP